MTEEEEQITGYGSDYDGQDQAYQDLLDENDALIRKNDELRFMIESIASIIYYQAPLKEQDKWLEVMIERGFYTVEEK